MSSAPQLFAEWMSTNSQPNKRDGREYRYHPRSDTHSKIICDLMIRDLMAMCPKIAADATAAAVAYNVNEPMVNPLDNKTKNVDVAIGEPAGFILATAPGRMPLARLATVRFATEAKSCMTEHLKSKPRLYDELNSSHTIVHAAYPDAIAAGLLVVNIAPTFVSPLRQFSSAVPLEVTQHKSPHCAATVIDHLRTLPMAQRVGEAGFDAFAVIVVNCDNIGPCALHTAPPAPQKGDLFHYDTFLAMVCEKYTSRF